MDEIIEVNTDQQPTTQPADNGNQGGEKLFTQEQVNQIVSDRLKREREKSAPPEPTEEEKRQQELTARENKLSCREYVKDHNLPEDLLDLFDTSNYSEFMRKADIVTGMLRAAKGPAPLYNPESASGGADVPPVGFRKTKHIPKQYPRSFGHYDE